MLGNSDIKVGDDQPGGEGGNGEGPDNGRATSSGIESQPRLRDAGWTWDRMLRRYRFAIITVINLTVFFLIWEILGRTNAIGPTVAFPSFTEMLEALRIGWIGKPGFEGPQNLLDNGIIATNFWITLKVYTIGMLISIALGIPLGLAMGGSKWVDAILSPYVWTLSALPRIAIYPILVLMPFIGIGEGSPIKYILIILTAIFPIIINTWAGVKTTDRSLISAARVFGASRVKTYRKVVLPFTLPFVVSGIQLSLGRGLVGAVVAEFLSGANKDGGLGWLIFRSAAAFNAPLTYASLFTLAIFALVLVQGTRSFEARVAPWRTTSVN